MLVRRPVHFRVFNSGCVNQYNFVQSWLTIIHVAYNDENQPAWRVESKVGWHGWVMYSMGYLPDVECHRKQHVKSVDASLAVNSVGWRTEAAQP